MRTLIGELVDVRDAPYAFVVDGSKRGAGCGRDHIAAHFQGDSERFRGKLQVVVDKFESTSART